MKECRAIPKIRFSLFIFLLLGVFLFSCHKTTDSFRVDLTNVCGPKNPDKEHCLTWYLKEGFSEDLINLKKDDPALQKEPWKKSDTIQILPSKIYNYPNNKTFGEWTFVTWFDYDPDVLKTREIQGILTGTLGEVFRIYINGHEIAGEGIAKDGKVVYHRNVRGQTYPIRSDYLKPKDNQLLFYIAGDPRIGNTGFYAIKDYTVGNFLDLRYERRDLAGLILIFIYLLAGLYHFLLYSKRRQEESYRNYAIFSVLIFAYLLTRHDFIFEFPVDSYWLQKVELSVLYIMLASLINFLEMKLNGRIYLIGKIYTILLILIAVLTWFVPIYIAEYILRTWQTSVLFAFPYVLFVMIRAKLQKKEDAGRLLFGIIVLMGAGIFDIVDSAFLNTGLTFTKYGMAFFVLAIGAILASRFMQVHNQVEELNKNLEQKVKERTQELQNTLATVQELKIKQDGDYFLTSLLLKPLNGNFSHNKRVDIEIFLKQKKEFKFRKWETEIGGDLCLAYDLVLRGKEYVVFINADAMGKSIQGAGGALVGGVVFKSVVTRTQLSAQGQNKMPERWLKDCFTELQNTFVSFDGSMLISAVIGVVDTETGFMYYLNAEHPFPVLYRQGKAAFLGTDSVLRKIGVEAITSRLSIETHQLERDDVLYLGSDGRDDLLIGEEDGHRVINEDEGLFLQLVESANGLLPKLLEEMNKAGELTDDLSLIRLSYLEDAPLDMNAPSFEVHEKLKEAQNLASGRTEDAQKALTALDGILKDYPSFAEAQRLRAFVQLKLQDFRAARRELSDYLEKHPGDAEAMGKFIYCNKKLKDYQTAIDYGEALRLRDRKNLRNLITLSDCYRLLGNQKRAKKILQEAEALDATDTNIQKLKSLLEE